MAMRAVVSAPLLIKGFQPMKKMNRPTLSHFLQVGLATNFNQGPEKKRKRSLSLL
jgi:hypothetical protein